MEILPEGVKEAGKEFVHSAQCEAFQYKYLALTSGKLIPSKSQPTKLYPKLDKEGCICSDGS